MDAVHILHTLCRLPVDPSSPDSKAMYDKRICALLLKNRGVVNPVATFAISYLSQSPVTDMEWAGMEGYRLFCSLMISVEASRKTLVSRLPGRESGR